jgi:hypothetical protein
MVITVGSELEVALNELARRQGVTPEAAAIEVLRDRLLPPQPQAPTNDEWMRRLREAAIDCGVSLSNEAVSSEGLYD